MKMFTVSRSWRGRTAAVWALVLAALAAAACDKVPLMAPSESTITMSAPTRTLPTGGSTQVTAFVAESAGTPVQNGTTVRFTTTLGRVEPIEAQTRNGFAEATFFAGDTSGVAEIRATSGGAGGGTSGGTGTGTNGTSTTTTTATATNVVQITIGGAAAAAVSVSASPSTVPSSGGTTTLIASAVDVAGNRLRSVPITFSTTAGTLSASSAISDDNGDARVQLTTSREATVTARAGNQTATVTVTVAIASSVALAVSPTNPVANQPVTLTVTPTIAAGNPPPRVVVDWGDGSRDDIGLVPAARGVTHIYARAGSYAITATVTSETETFTTSLGVTVGATPAVEISVSPLTGRVNVTNFVFTVTPAVGTTPQNVIVFFGDGTDSGDLGPITGPTQVSHVYSATGSQTVRARQTNADGTTSTATVVVSVTP